MTRHWRARPSERPPGGAAPAATGPGIGARLLLGLLVAAAVLTLDRRAGDTSDLRRLELVTLDWRFRLRGPVEPGSEVAIVTVDDRSVAALGSWPPPREALAEAISRLALVGAGPIVLNLLLAEPAPGLPAGARDALAAALPHLPDEAGPLRAEVLTLLGREFADDRLGTAIALAGRVVLPYAFVAEPGSANVGGVPPWIAATAFPAHVRAPAGDAAAPFEGRGILTLAPGLAARGASQGHVTLLVDEDGALRFDLPALAYADAYYPSIALEAARLRLELAREEVVPWLGRRLALGRRSVPLDREGRMAVNHYGPEGTFPTFSLADLLAGTVEPARLAGRVVVLGASAAATGDRFATPFTSRLPGGEQVAAVIDNLLHGRALRRDGAVRLADGLAIVGLALAAALAAGRRSAPASLGTGAALAGGWLVLASAALAAGHTWLAVVTPILAVLLGTAAVELPRAGREQRRRRRLERQRANLARYFPPLIVDRLAADGGVAGLERTQEAAVMFVDMVGFTAATENLPPAAAVDLLRAFHRRVERAVFAHGGMLDKFIGDGALACFGVPDPTDDASAAALRAARALLGEMAAWGEELAADGRPSPRVAVGVHVGPVLMGDIGGERQFQFTVVGDTVNVASRLETLTRQVGASVLASAAVVERARTAADAEDVLAGFEPLPALEIRGRAGRVVAWRLPRQDAGPDPAARLDRGATVTTLRDRRAGA